jgi:type II secretory ATPase GspE/PulE/Tfp pilus assembly ATPase PilB-like protein
LGPIEYQIDGISQMQIGVKKGLTFAAGVTSVLRQDPDVIMVGEIRVVALTRGMQLLRNDGVRKILQGLTTAEEDQSRDR